MITNYKSDDFILNGGYYYSPSFKIESSDDLIAIEMNLSEYGEVSIQSSIDGLNWYNIPNTSFICNPNGLQSYKECQKDLFYKLKSSVLVNEAKILI